MLIQKKQHHAHFVVVVIQYAPQQKQSRCNTLKTNLLPRNSGSGGSYVKENWQTAGNIGLVD